MVGQPYMYELTASCGSYSNLTWEGFIPVEGLPFLSQHGVISGVPSQVTDNGPFEFQLEVMINGGQAGVQNYLLEIVAPDGGT